MYNTESARISIEYFTESAILQHAARFYGTQIRPYQTLHPN